MNTFAPVLAMLAATHGGGGGALSRAPSGAFIAADTGGAVMLASDQDPSRGAWSFAFRVGHQWRSGVALDARFDDLGVHSPDGSGPMLLGSAGFRYTLPLVAIMPFAEARVGADFYGPHSSPAAGFAVGMAIPVLRHLAIELDARDWIADIDGAVRHVPTFEGGLAVGFGGH